MSKAPRQHVEAFDEMQMPIGRDPRKMSVEKLAACGHPPIPILKAVRQNCIGCCAGNEAEVRRCAIIACPLWPFRMSHNPYTRKGLSEEERQAIAERARANLSKKRITLLKQTETVSRSVKEGEAGAEPRPGASPASSNGERFHRRRGSNGA